MTTLRRYWLPAATAAIALASLSVQAEELRFVAELNGASQLPEPTASKATGECVLVVQEGGKKISYTLTVTDLSNAASAELHLGSNSMNGPGVVKLFPAHGATAKKGPYTGVLAEGTITAANLLGSMQGSSLSDLIDELKAGNAYVNIHTNDGVDPPNSGPGDYRLGEIRGQIEPK
jgi:hypothetical protein